MALNEILLALFDRPNEPLFLPKGDEQFTFHMPEDYLADRFKKVNIADRFGVGGQNVVDLKQITLPDLDLPLQLQRTAQFTPFIPLHRRMAGELIEKFLGMKNTDDFLSCAAFCRQNMNPLLFNYAFSVALLHRNDTRGFDVPPLHEFFPDKFIDRGIFNKARMEANISSTVQEIVPEPIEVPLDYTASDLDPEHRVAYFREDVGINLHHWHWHLVFPFLGPRRVVAKDRRGEIFYFMHQQIIARYNFERLCNKLARVKKLIDLRSPIAEAYFPKLDSLTASRVWAARSPNSTLQDINREAEQLVFDIQDLERWRDRLYEAVSTGRVIDSQGQSIPLTEEKGIDILGDLIEASSLSINRNLYGDLHNLGHAALSLVHDPEFKYLENVSVVGDLATAMRDPVFYRWHAFIDDIFLKYKQTLPPYTVQQLGFDGIRINSVEVNSKSSPKNQFSTFWQQSDVNLTRGMDFAPRGDVAARITHLQHQPFEYKIKVTNTGQPRQGTVRIFLAPRFDERGLPYLFNDERKMMIEVDRFVHNFKQQSDTVTRKSKSSTLIIPFERTFRDLRNADSVPGGVDAFNFCGCGWPEHMMIPKGTPEGFPATLFVMVSDYQLDKVDDPTATKSLTAGCEPAMIYCGIRDQKYPDARPMGFPFDRVGRAGVNNMRDFLTPNMLTQEVIIKFSNVILPPGSVSRG